MKFMACLLRKNREGRFGQCFEVRIEMVNNNLVYSTKNCEKYFFLWEIHSF